MCISDWRIGRLLKVQSTPFSIAAGTGLDYPINKQRAGIIIGLSQTAGQSLERVKVSIDGNLHGEISVSQSHKEWSLRLHGDLPTRHFVLSQSTTIAIGSVIELIAPEELLNMPLEEYLRAYKSWHPSS